MRELEIDIAVDLNGFTDGCAAEHLRPAAGAGPGQLSRLSPARSAQDYCDYIIADRFVIPEGAQAHYAEKVVYLPGLLHGQRRERQDFAARRRRAPRRGCRRRASCSARFNNSYKITPDVFDVWMRLLREVDGSVLWLLERATRGVGRNLRREAAARGRRARSAGVRAARSR